MTTRQAALSRLGLFGSGAALFCVLATLNATGYRYGVSDQAFHIPAILLNVDGGLYPHDAPLIRAQGQLMVFDEAVATLSDAVGLSLPTLFIAGYVAGLLLLVASAAAIGRTLYRSWWTVVALGFALTLRHQIADTGVNTLEGYLQPRILAFAVGAAALLVFLRGRSWAALALAAADGLLHPVVALWFVVWIAVGTLVADPRARRPLLACAVVASVAALWALTWGPLQGRLVRMDDNWLAVLASKDYLFPDTWPWHTWVLNLGYMVAIVAIHHARGRVADVSRRETGLVAGCAALVLIFLVSLPLIAMRLALAVQLQTSRVFWMLDLLATIYIVWLVVERPSSVRRRTSPFGVRRVAVATFVVAAFARGGYVTFIEHPERPVLEVRLRSTEWNDVMGWVARTPPGTNVLADPAHAVRYGPSVRVAGRRDVYLEEVKDAALSIYSADAARRVRQRTQDLGEFQGLTPGHARALAVTYDLDYLISDQPIDLPVIYRNDRFIAYALR